MAQNIYDNKTFFDGYLQLPRQVYGLEGAPEWPATKAMFPDIQGKRAVDLGCGLGWVCRWMRENGASSVLGIDLSENMIMKAKEKTNDTAIEYQVEDLDKLNLPSASCDFVFSSLTFHYIQDFDRLIQTIHQGLKPSGHLVFTMEHPIYMSAKNSQWQQDEEGHKIWSIRGYSKEGKRESDWFVKGVIKYHRTIATTVNTLISHGFVILRLEEFAPTKEQIVQNSSLEEELERPMMLLISATKRPK